MDLSQRMVRFILMQPRPGGHMDEALRRVGK